MSFSKRYDTSCNCERLVGDFFYPSEEERDPAFPITLIAHSLQSLVIFLPMGLEIDGEIEDWLRHQALLAEQESDEESTTSAVSIKEGMNRQGIL